MKKINQFSSILDPWEERKYRALATPNFFFLFSSSRLLHFSTVVNCEYCKYRLRSSLYGGRCSFYWTRGRGYIIQWEDWTRERKWLAEDKYTVARNRKKRLVIGACSAAMHRLEKARGDCGDCARSSRESVKGRVKNNRANRKGRRRDRLRPFENRPAIFFSSSFSFFFFSFFPLAATNTTGNGEVKPGERDSVETLITSCWPLAADISATRRVRRLGFGPVIVGSTAHGIYYGRSTPARIICNKL